MLIAMLSMLTVQPCLSAALQDAIASCPVDCIHWVDAAELPALEYVTQSKIKMSNVAAMMAGQGGAVADVFAAARRFLRHREEK